MKKFLILNGPNLNLLGVREPQIYGTQSYGDLVNFVAEFSAELGIFCSIFQSNHEGALVEEIHKAMHIYDGIIINPAAYTHTSVAIADALKSVSIPAVEIHLSDINAREEYRKRSYTSEGCLTIIAGKGFLGYKEGAKYLLNYLEEQTTIALEK